MSYAVKLANMLERLIGPNEKVNPDEIVPGSIFCAVDYYSEYNNKSYYQVVKRTPQSVYLVRMKGATNGNYAYNNGYDDSTPNGIDPNAKEIRCKLYPGGYVKINRYLTAYIYSIPSGKEV